MAIVTFPADYGAATTPGQDVWCVQPVGQAIQCGQGLRRAANPITTQNLHANHRRTSFMCAATVLAWHGPMCFRVLGTADARRVSAVQQGLKRTATRCASASASVSTRGISIRTAAESRRPTSAGRQTLRWRRANPPEQPPSRRRACPRPQGRRPAQRAPT